MTTAEAKSLVQKFVGRGIGFRVDTEPAWRVKYEARKRLLWSRGLTTEGNVRKRKKKDRGGLSKDRAAYMRVYRAEKANDKR